MYIDRETEYQLIQRVCKQLEYYDFDPHYTLVLNVSPDYSSTVAMHIAHHLSKNGEMLDIMPVDVPFPKQSADPFRIAFETQFATMPLLYHKFILVEAAVLSGNNYTWIKEVMLDSGLENDDIVTVALLEKEASVFKSNIVGEYSEQIPEFYWERYNKHWD